MQFTINDQVMCTTKSTCVAIYEIPHHASDPYTINIAVTGMGYSIPMQFIVRDFVPITFRALFNLPPEITAINSGISLLHQIGTSTTISASFQDAEGSNIKYTWSTEAIQGSCYTSELSGTLTDTVASGSTVSIIFTPVSLGNKCIIKIRCEDSNGAVSLGEVYVYVDNVPIYFPPYIISKLQSKQTASVGEKVHMSLEICEPQSQMITLSWSTNGCGSLNHAADSIGETDDCTWVYNDVIINSLPCSVNWIASDSDASVSSGKFRILSGDRRLSSMPFVRVETTEKTLKTIMSWPQENTQEIKYVDNNMSPEGVALLVICIILCIAIVGGFILWKQRGSDCVVPQKDVELGEQVKTTERNFCTYNVTKEKRKPPAPPNTTPPAPKKIEHDLSYYKSNIRLGNRKKLIQSKRFTADSRKKSLIEVKHRMLPVNNNTHPKNDSEWFQHINKHHNTIKE